MCAISIQKKRSETLLHTSPYLLSSFFSGNRGAKFQKCSEREPASHEHRSLPHSSLAVIYGCLQCGFARSSLSAHLRQCLDRISKPLTVMISTEGRRCSHRRTSTPDCAVEGFRLGFRLAGHCALIDHAQPRPHSGHFHGN